MRCRIHGVAETATLRLVLCIGLLALSACTDTDGVAPLVLTDLRVEGTRTALNPAFDPAVLRYSVIASDPAQEVSITPVADPSLLISVNGQLATSGTRFAITPLAVGDTVEIVVQTSGPRPRAAIVYELLYLPADFPELQVTVLEDGVSTDPLYVSLRSARSNYIAILNNHGVPSFFRYDDQFALDFKWHAVTGERSYARFTGTRNQWGRRDTERVVLNPAFHEIDRITTEGLSHTDHHDFLIEENNELLLISYDGSLRDMTAHGLSSEELVEDSVVQILDRATRQVLFEWSSWNQLPYEEQLYPEKRAEYAHVNSLFVDTDGNIIVSARGTSQVVKISRPGGQVLWKLGGKSNQFHFVNDPFSQICGQHTASRLENGNLLIFDNGQNCWPVDLNRGELTRVVEYRIDEQALEAELVWSYSQPGAYATAAGSAQRLANGNTLIGWGFGPSVLATEVTGNGTKVFEIVAFDAETPVISYRALRFPE